MAANDETGRFLTIYLRDHFAGSAAGAALARRCLASNEHTEYEEELAAIARQIEEDRTTLEQLMARLDVSPSRVKSVMGSVADVVGRVKSNGRLFSYSPLSRVLELEALSGGIAAKRDLWRSLAALADDQDPLDGAELEALVERATSQLERVHDLHADAAREAFARADGDARRPHRSATAATRKLSRRAVTGEVVAEEEREER